MTVATSTHAPASPAGPSPRAQERWVTPALTRMNGAEAENAPNPGGGDGGFSSGS